MQSCWPGQGCTGWDWNSTSPNGWIRPSFCRRWGRGLWGSNAGVMMRPQLALLERLDDPVTHRAVLAERAALATLEGGCTLPMAAWARDIEGDEATSEVPALAINAAVFDPTAVLV